VAADVDFAVVWIENETLARQFRHFGSWILFLMRQRASLAIVLWRSTIAAVELSQSDHGPATSASSLVFVIGSTSFSLWARFSDGAFTRST